MIEEVDADPDQIRAQIEEEAERGGRLEVSPELSPEAKRALLAAYEESRSLGASYIGPEHVLLALTRDEESEAGKLLSRFGLSHTKVRGEVVRGVDKGGEAGLRETVRFVHDVAGRITGTGESAGPDASG